MAQRMSFEEVVSDLQAKNPHMSYGDALDWVRNQYSAGNADIHAIPDVHGKIMNAHLHAAIGQFMSGAEHTMAAPFGKLSEMIAAGTDPSSKLHRGAEIFSEAVSPQEEQKVGEEVGQAPVAKFLGQGAGMYGLAESTGLGPLTRAVLPGASILGRGARGATEMLGLQKMGALGDMTPGQAIFWGAAPEIGLGLGGKLGRGLGWLKPLEEGAPKPRPPTPEELKQMPWWAGRPKGAKAAEATKAAGPMTQEGVEAAVGMQRSPTLQGQYTTPTDWTDEAYQRAAGGGKPEAPVDPTIVPAPGGLSNMRPGQPYQSQFMSRIPSDIHSADIFHAQDHPIYGSGQPYPASWDKPLVIDVPGIGPEGWQHAATSLWQDNPAAVKAIQEAKDPVGLSQQLIARRAKARGFDSVNLNPADGKSGVVLDLRTFEKTDHPELTPEITRFQKQPKPEPVVEKPPASKAADAGEVVFGKKPKKGEGAVPFEPARAHAMGDPTLAKAIEAHESIVERAKAHAAGDITAQDVAESNDRLTGHIGGMQPEIQAGIRKYLEKGSRRRQGIVRWLAPGYMSDHPVYQGMIQDTYTQLAESNVAAAAWAKEYGEIRNSYPKLRNPKDFDETARAVDGLRFEPEDGYKGYVQTALNVDPAHDEVARKLAALRDKGYGFLTRNDPRVPYVLEARGLTHNRRQLERLLQMQTDEGTLAIEATRQPPSETEYHVANELKALGSPLGFNETHDLDFEPITGWMKFHPHANEKAMLEAAIQHAHSMQEGNPGYKPSFAQEEELKQMLERNQELEQREEKRMMSRMPARDFTPKRKWMSILHGSGHPYYYSTNPDEIMSQWVTGVTQKRIADVNLARTKMLLRDGSIDGTTKDYAVEYANAVRGSTGYAGDAKFALGLENMLHGMGLKGVKIEPHQVHEWTGTLQEINFITRLGLTPLRFPIINMTHLFPTAGAVARPGNFARGFMRTIGDMKGSYERAVKAGVISQQLEMFKEMGKKESKLTRTFKPLQALTWLTENFRKTVAHEIGLASAEAGHFNPVVRGFVNDLSKYGGNQQLMNEAYARAFTFTTQFEFGKVGKAVAMQGGPLRRTTMQFRSWESNTVGLFKEMLHQKEYGSFARGMAALAFLGGPAVALPLGTWHLLRNELLRNGINIPDKPGYHYALKFAGMDHTVLDEIDIRSLQDPFGMDPYGVSSFLGPTIGSIVELGDRVKYNVDHGRTYKLPKELLQTFAPQVQDMIEAGEEYFKGGIVGPGGMIDSNRPLLSIIARGVDLQTSLTSQRAAYEQDIEQALQSNNPRTVQDIVDEMTRKGIPMGPDIARRVRAFTRSYQRSKMQPWEF